MKKEIEELSRTIKKHKLLYYQGAPEISDIEFDKLEENLKKMDPNNNVLSLVGSDYLIGEKISHQKKMLSLEKTYVTHELIKWKEEHELIVLYKVDGVSCSLIYKAGQFSLAKTRGDGEVGENISNKVRWIESIPLMIKIIPDCEIRGELLCTNENFILLSDTMEKQGLQRPTNPRNIVAGLLGRKEEIHLCKFISFKAFDLITEAKMETEIDKLNILKENNFDLPWCQLIKNESDINDVIKGTSEFMAEGDYQIDGLVFSYNKLSLHEQFGATAHHPRYRIAYKFKGESKKSELISVEWSLSMNGIYTPIAIISPTELSGAIVERVTMHNWGFVKAYNLHYGDLLEVIRSGEVIPKIIGSEQKGTRKILALDQCYFCKEQNEIDELRVICVNEKCPGRLKFEILNYISKIDIVDISEKRLEEMQNKGLVKNIADLYILNQDDFLKLDKTKEKLAKKMYQSIQKTKNPKLEIFLSALGINGAAKTKCEKIVQSGFDTIEKVLNITEEELMNIDGFAKKSSQEFIQSLKSKEKTIDKILNAGVKPFTDVSNVKNDTAISGLKFCLTGTLSIPREKLSEIIKLNGGKTMSSVSNETNYLLTNDLDSKSSKFVKAKKLGISIINEDSFYKLLGAK